MLPKNILIKYLTEFANLSVKNQESLGKKAQQNEKELEQYLLDEEIIEEATLYTWAAKEMEVPLTDIHTQDIPKEVYELIPQPLAETHQIIAFKKTDNQIHLAMGDPLDIQTVEFIRRKTGLTPKIFLSKPSVIKKALRLYHTSLEDTFKSIESKQKSNSTDLKKVAEELPIINIVKSILEHAVYQGASDIHIEPVEKEITVRYRVDGILRNMMNLPKNVQRGIIARIKILANLKIDEHMVPQDGRFKIKLHQDKVSFRVSIMPVYDGEKIVMRLLQEGQKPLSLDDLGFLPGPRNKLEAAIEKPHGMVLVTGPTGSGKTTTLYSLLGILNQPDVNICTIEDPIEYHVKGINQSQVNARVGFNFAGGLKAFLRQDPDIIMVGEIRDKDTAEIAIHASMTGHLVLSTLHTNDAPTTLPRLIDMEIPPFLVAFTANVIVAQRLVRKICEKCKQEYTLEKKAVSQLEKMNGIKKIIPLLEKNKVAILPKEKNVGTMIFYRGAGCRTCNETGYKGRVGIYEVLEIDKEMSAKINNNANAQEISKQAETQGMMTMLQDGIIKAKQGITTIEEVLRVTRE